MPLSSATPFSSTEVTSLRKIATFIFKYRPSNVLQYHSIIPKSVIPSSTAVLPRLGEKRLAFGDYSDTDSCHTESDEDYPSRVDGDTFSPTFVFLSSDSDSSQVHFILYSCRGTDFDTVNPIGLYSAGSTKETLQIPVVLRISVSQRATGKKDQTLTFCF